MSRTVNAIIANFTSAVITVVLLLLVVIIGIIILIIIVKVIIILVIVLISFTMLATMAFRSRLRVWLLNPETLNPKPLLNPKP